MSKITAETELMKNQKHADVMAPDTAFEVIQTTDGDALFFSIGTDKVFYVTREVRNSNTGWTRIDLSSLLSKSHGNAKVAAKSFALSQNAQTLAFDAALVVTVAGVDFLYISLNHSNTPASWANPISWTVVPFDAASITPPNPLTIADVYLMNIPSSDGSDPVQNCFVDILRNPGNPLKLLDRYYIQPGSSPQWVRHTLAADLKAGSISSCLGHRTDDFVPGIYTFGAIGNTQELIYSPQYNFFRPAVAPNAARLTLPAGSTSIASALNSNGDTNLFVAAAGGLYLFTPDNQGDQSSPVLVVPSSTIAQINILGGVSSLSASTTSTRTVVWGLNAQGDLFYVGCPAGSEATASAWSIPIPLSSGVEGFAFYLNIHASNNVLFAHLSGQQLQQLTQDPVTGAWTQRSILLPATKVDDIIEYNSFTTHISITDGNGSPVANTPVTVTSTSPVSVYINNVYFVLTPTVPVNATSDFAGSITVIQETQSLSAVCFKVTIAGPPSVVVNVDPLSKAMQTLSAVKTGDDLANVQIKTANGTTQPLVPGSVPSDAKNAAAKSIVNLINVKNTLPADGSRKTTTSPAPHVTSTLAVAQPQQVWGVSLKNGFTLHEGAAVAQHIGTPAISGTGATKTVSLLSVGQAIEIGAGDFFNFLKNAWADVENFVVQEAEGFYHFIATIAGKVYSAILDSVSAVVGAVEFVFNQIKVFFEELIAWLGFLFDWDDIKITHSVIKNILKQFGKQLVTAIDSVETSIDNAFITLENQINSWAGVQDPGETVGTRQQTGSSAPGISSPQTNWAMYHTNNGMSDSSTSYNPPNTGSSTLDQLLSDLVALVENEEEYIKTTVDQIKSQVVDQFFSLSPVQVIKKVIGIASDLILKTARNLIVKVIDIIKIVISGFLDLLDAPIDIPILSSIYKYISGDQLSILDLVCLVGAIPGTIIYKIFTGQTPFPNDSNTQALINAPDFATLQNLLNPKTPSPAKPSPPTVHPTVAAALTTEQPGKPSPASSHPQIQSLSSVHVLAAADQAAPPVQTESSAPSGLDTINKICNILAFPGSLLVANCAIKKHQTEGLPSTSIRAIAAASYLLYVAPDISGAFYSSTEWYVQMNYAITIVATVKTWADNTVILSNYSNWNDYASPILESIINATWLTTAIAPIVANTSPKASDWCSMGANLAFDIGGVITFLTIKKIPPPVPEVAFGIAQLLTVAYGILGVAVAEALAHGN
jgi:hypothetical protein